MAIRTNTNPRAMDLQPEMRDILMRNGLQAHIAFDGGGYKLIVQGHDSPLLTYQITEKQPGNKHCQQESLQCAHKHPCKGFLSAQELCPCPQC